MNVSTTITIKALRAALADADIEDLAAADAERQIDVDVDMSPGFSWRDEEDEPQLDADALDDFMSAAIGGDRRMAAVLAGRLFTDRNLDLVERRLVS